MVRTSISFCLAFVFLLCGGVVGVTPVSVRIDANSLQSVSSSAAKDTQHATIDSTGVQMKDHIIRRQIATMPQAVVEESHKAERSSTCPIYDEMGSCSEGCSWFNHATSPCSPDESVNPCGCVPSYYTCTCTPVASSAQSCSITQPCSAGYVCDSTGVCVADGPANYQQAYAEAAKFTKMELEAERKAGVYTTTARDDSQINREEDETIKRRTVGAIFLIGLFAVCGVGGVVMSKRRTEHELEDLKAQMNQGQHAGHYDPNMHYDPSQQAHYDPHQGHYDQHQGHYDAQTAGYDPNAHYTDPNAQAGQHYG